MDVENGDGADEATEVRAVGCETLSGSEDKRARGPVAPRGFVAIIEKLRT